MKKDSALTNKKEMTQNIVMLNDYCLFEIFKQIKYNCERGESVLYADLINFSMACSTLRQKFWTWNKDLFMKLGVNKKKRQTIDFNVLYNDLKNFSMKDKEMWWKYFCSHIKEHNELTSMRLVYQPTSYNSEHSERFTQVYSALANSNIEELEICFSRCYSVDTLTKLPNLQVLYLDVKVNAYDLIEICKMCPLLQELTFLSTDIYGNLADIAPYCQKLRDLIFTMKPEIDASEYAPFGNLPALKSLTVKGRHHQVGTLVKLFSLLAEEPQSIQNIFIEHSPLDYEETKALKKLILLKCSIQISDIRSIEHLYYYRTINVFRYLHDVWTDLWQILQRTKKSICLCLIDWHIIYNNEFNDILLKKPNVIFSDDLKPFPRPHLTNLKIISILNERKSELLKAYFINNIPKQSQSLQTLWILVNSTIEKITEIRSVQPLEKLTCEYVCVSDNIGYWAVLPLIGKLQQTKLNDSLDIVRAAIDIPKNRKPSSLNYGLSDTKSIENLIKLPNIHYLHIRDLHNFHHDSKYILGILELCKNNMIYVGYNECYIKNENDFKTLTLEMNYDVDASIYAPLARLKDINSLQITGSYQSGTLQPLFKAFTSQYQTTLREIYIKVESPLSFEEIIEVTRIKSLQIIRCQFAEKNVYVENLYSSIGDWNSNRFLSDGVYFSHGIIKTLKKGQLTIKCKNDIDPNQHIKNVENLQSLIIELDKNYKNGLLDKLFVYLQENPTDSFQELIVRSVCPNEVATLNATEVSQIAQIKSLRKLECGFQNVLNLELLANLCNLKVLIITQHEKGSLSGLFKEIASKCDATKLKTLVVKREQLTTEEKTQIKLIKSLEYLDITYPYIAGFFEKMKR